MQPDTSEIITDFKNFTKGSELKLLLMLMVLLGDLFSFWKKGSLLGYIWLLQNTENLRIGATDVTKKIGKPAAVLHNFNQEDVSAGTWPGRV